MKRIVVLVFALGALSSHAIETKKFVVTTPKGNRIATNETAARDILSGYTGKDSNGLAALLRTDFDPEANYDVRVVQCTASTILDWTGAEGLLKEAFTCSIEVNVLKP